MESKLSRALAPKRPDAPTLTSRQLVKAWWQALRPPFFIVDLIPVGLGGALAARDLGYWPWGIFAVVMVGCFCLHTVANIANDLFDYLEGVDTDETIGGTKVIQNGWISPRQICLTIIGLLLSTVLIGWWLIGHSGQEWLWGPVVFAVLSAVFYVAPPIRYGCRGYGELFVCLNMGFIMVMGSYAVMANGFSAQSLALALPVGLMVAGILYYQSLPEIETDLAAGKRTLANILGKAKAELVFKLWWPAVWVLMANLWACGLVGWPVFLGLLTFPLYWRACRLVHEAVEWLDLDQHGHLVRKLYLINGALIGFLFLNPLLGIVAGAGLGAATGEVGDFGISHRFMNELATHLKPGSSALFIPLKKEAVDETLRALGNSDGVVLSTDLKLEDEYQMEKLFEEMTAERAKKTS